MPRGKIIPSIVPIALVAAVVWLLVSRDRGPEAPLDGIATISAEHAAGSFTASTGTASAGTAKMDAPEVGPERLFETDQIGNGTPALERFTYAQGWRQPQPAAMSAFRDWTELYREAQPGAAGGMIREGVALARARRTEMLAMIQNDPSQALAHTVPAALRAGLPADVLAELEEPVSGLGDYALIPHEPSVEENPARQPSVTDRRVFLDGTTYTAHVYGRRARQLTQENASLHGIALDGHIAVHESPLRVLESGERSEKPIEPHDPITGAPIGTLDPSDAVLVEAHDRLWMLAPRENVLLLADELDAAEALPGPKVPAMLGSTGSGGPVVSPASATAWTTGLKKVLVVRVDFSDAPALDENSDGVPDAQEHLPTGEAFSAQAWNDLFEDEIAPTYDAGSYGAVSLQWNVSAGIHRMPKTAASYATADSSDQLHDDATAAAGGAGENPNDYDVVCVVHSYLGPSNISGSKFTWAGLAGIGGSRMWINGFFDHRTVAHELGHTYGLLHANLWDTPNSSDPLSAEGVVREYQDAFDIMGGDEGDPSHHFNVLFKNQLGWLSDDRVVDVIQSGPYRLHRFDLKEPVASEPLALRIRRGAGRDYWLAYRQPAPYPGTPLADGVYALWKMAGADDSRLLDLSQGNGRFDVALPVGAVLDDSVYNITVTTTSTGGNGSGAYVDVQIEMGAEPSFAVSAWGDDVAVADVPPLLTSDGVRSTASGSNHMLALKSDGRIHAWGEDVSTHVPQPGLDNVIRIDARKQMNAAVLSGGGVVLWGESSWNLTAAPTEASDARDVALGARHAVALKSDGTAVVWGDSSSGQTSVPPTAVQGVAVAAGDTSSFMLRADATVVGWGPSHSNPPGGLSDVVAISAGSAHALALRRDGTVVGWGASYADARNVPAGLDNVRSILAIGRRSMALRADGTILIWGDPTFGSGDSPEMSPPVGLRPAIGLSAGPSHSAVLHGTGAPAITVQPWNRTVEAGETAKFTTLAVGNGTIGYRWQRQATGSSGWADLTDGSGYSGVSTPTLEVVLAPPANSGDQYRCVVSGTVGPDAVSEAVTLLQSGSLLEITSPPADVTVLVGETATFSVTPSGATPFSYQWLKNGAPIAGATSAQLSITNVTLEDGGNYAVSVSNSAGALTSSSAALVVQAPPVFTVLPGEATAIAGQTVSIIAAANGAPTPTFSWRKNGASIPGANNSTLTILGATSADAGQYTVVAENAVGSAEAGPVTLTVLETGSDGVLVWRDFGNPSKPGAQAYQASGDRFHLSVNGGDMWGIEDQLRFGQTEATGDGEIIVLVENLTGPHAWSRAGLSIRDTLAPDSAHVTLVASMDNDVDLQWRSLKGGETANLGRGGSGNPTPVFLRLVRAGNTFTGYRSSDGATWSELGSATVSMSGSVHTGVVACGILDTAPTVAEVSGFQSSFAAAKTPAVVTLSALSAVYDGSPKTPVVTTNPGGLDVDITYDGVSTAPTNAGNYAVVAVVDDPAHAGSAEATLTISPAPHNVSFATPADATFGDPAISLSATSSAGLPVTFSIVSGPAALDGTQVALSGAGTVVVRASAAGNNNYVAAPDVDRTFIIARAPQTITFAPIASATVGDPATVLSATASSALPVALTVVSGPAELDGALLAILDSGTVTVRASQGGDANYLPAEDIDRSFEIAPVPTQPVDPTGIYFGELAALSADLPPPAPTGSEAVWGLSVDPDGFGRFLAYLPNGQISLVADIFAGEDGTFSGTTEAAGLEINISGRITDGQVSGEITALGVAFSGAIDTSDAPGANAAGLYRASVLNAAEGVVHALLGASGHALLVVTASGMNDGGTDIINTSGRILTNLLAGTAVDVRINSVIGSLSGTVALNGTATALSVAGLSAAVAPINQLVNLSTRGFAGSGDDVMIVGFVLEGAGTRRCLVRAIGPTLADQFGVQGAMANPKLAIQPQGNNPPLVENDDWSTNANLADVRAAMDEVGAFAVPDDSRDAMVLVDLPAGAFTATVSGAASGSGVTIAEVYALGNDDTFAARLKNISTRGFVGAGDAIMIPGFSTDGNTPRRLLIRAAGPALIGLGVDGALEDPVLEVHIAGGGMVTSNDDWDVGSEDDTLADAMTAVGAFELPRNSKDAALLLTVPPNTGYTIQVSGKDGATGVVLAEVYEMD